MSRKRNWPQYNKQLVQRGNVSFLLDPKIFEVKKTCGMGRPQIYSNPLIMMLMMAKIHLQIPYRTLQGFAESLMDLANRSDPIPNYTLICRRSRNLKLPKLSSKRPQVVAVDSSGIKVYAEGEWKVKIHGKSKRRKWLKVHIAVDPKTGLIVSETTTDSYVHDGQIVKSVLKQVPGSIKTVLADGAYEGRASRQLIKEKGARALIPPPKNARMRGIDPNRDDAIRIIRGLGNDFKARSLWGRFKGYSQRSLVESAFSRMKRMFGSRLFSKRFDAQRVENRLRCMLLNTFTDGQRSTFNLNFGFIFLIVGGDFSKILGVFPEGNGQRPFSREKPQED